MSGSATQTEAVLQLHNLLMPLHLLTQVPIASQMPPANMCPCPCTNARCLLQAKKKAQQDKDGAKRSQAATSTPAQTSKASQADSSESEEEEERERFSLLDSRFASLMDDSDKSLVRPQGAEAAPFSGQGSQLVPPLSTHNLAAGSTTADSDNGVEGENVQQQGLQDTRGEIRIASGMFASMLGVPTPYLHAKAVRIFSAACAT